MLLLSSLGEEYVTSTAPVRQQQQGQKEPQHTQYTVIQQHQQEQLIRMAQLKEKYPNSSKIQQHMARLKQKYPNFVQRYTANQQQQQRMFQPVQPRPQSLAQRKIKYSYDKLRIRIRNPLKKHHGNVYKSSLSPMIRIYILLRLDPIPSFLTA